MLSLLHGTELAANEYRLPEGRRTEEGRGPEEGIGRGDLPGHAQPVPVPLHRPQPDPKGGLYQR